MFAAWKAQLSITFMIINDEPLGWALEKWYGGTQTYLNIDTIWRMPTVKDHETDKFL